MGAWDTGSFSNDDALDFIAGVKSTDDLKRSFATLMAISGEPADAGLACEAIAAADMVAGMMGRPAPDMPDELEEALTGLGEPTPELLKKASKAVHRVLENSELAELWREADFAEWQEAIDDLLKRLDPKTPYESSEDAAEPGGGFICLVCNKSIPDNELVGIEIFLTDMPGVSMGYYLHGACMEEKFEAPYLDANGKPHDSLVTQVKAYLEQL